MTHAYKYAMQMTFILKPTKQKDRNVIRKGQKDIKAIYNQEKMGHNCCISQSSVT